MDNDTWILLRLIIALVAIVGSYMINPNLVPVILGVIGGISIPKTAIADTAVAVVKNGSK